MPLEDWLAGPLSAGAKEASISAKERETLNTNTTHRIADKFKICIEKTVQMLVPSGPKSNKRYLQ